MFASLATLLQKEFSPVLEGPRSTRQEYEHRCKVAWLFKEFHLLPQALVFFFFTVHQRSVLLRFVSSDWFAGSYRNSSGLLRPPWPPWLINML